MVPMSSAQFAFTTSSRWAESHAATPRKIHASSEIQSHGFVKIFFKSPADRLARKRPSFTKRSKWVLTSVRQALWSDFMDLSLAYFQTCAMLSKEILQEEKGKAIRVMQFQSRGASFS